VTGSSPHLYRLQGINKGLNAGVVARAARQMADLEARGSYPLLSLGHLAHVTGASYPYLRQIVERLRDPYVDIVRQKRSGAMRSISSPEPTLMEVQRWILSNLVSRVQLHPSSYAYQPGRSIVGCAQQHVGARWLIKLDLHNFFEEIAEPRIYGIFRELAYAPLLSLELTRVCTRLRARRDEGYRAFETYTTIPSYITSAPGFLPQGAPTSGALANAVARTLDGKLSELAANRGLIYTRYSDDLVFSSLDAFDRRYASRLISHIRHIVEDQKFRLHVKKTRVIPPGARHIVLGLLVDDDRVRLLPEYKRRIEVHVRGVRRFGLSAHAAHRQFDSMFALIDHVDGSLAFAASVDSEFARRMRLEWNGALASSGYPVSMG
jgi:RNA-directed DNA polymerase